MIIVINGLPGTGKTTLSKMLVTKYGYKYVNDWEILKENNIIINELEDKILISKRYSKLIADYIIKNKDNKVVFDLEYTISPHDFIKHKLNDIAKCFYLGFSTLSKETIFSLFKKSSSNDNVSDNELKKKINFYKTCSLDYQEQCKKYKVGFIDICKNRNVIFQEIFQKINVI